MARRRTTRKRSRGRTSRAIPSISLRMPRMPELQQRDLDLIGLGLVALAAFFAFVFYLGWDGGKVGGALGDAFRFLLGSIGPSRSSAPAPSMTSGTRYAGAIC